tara:strand:+ start:87 stop:263 length:177 start_codon:yes stop_codon:yes gene_type:complete
LAIFLLRGEIKILVNGIFEVQIPEITDEAIFPVPMKPKFIFFIIVENPIYFLDKKKAP